MASSNGNIYNLGSNIKQINTTQTNDLISYSGNLDKIPGFSQNDSGILLFPTRDIYRPNPSEKSSGKASFRLRLNSPISSPSMASPRPASMASPRPSLPSIASPKPINNQNNIPQTEIVTKKLSIKPSMKETTKMKQELVGIQQKPVLIPPTPAPSVARDEAVLALVNNKYSTQHRIFEKTDNGEIIGRFIKVVSPGGTGALVDINVSGIMHHDDSVNDLISKRTFVNPGCEIAQTQKNAAYNCVGNAVSGIAFECPNGMCVIMRNVMTMQPEETYFVWKEGECMNVNVSILALPIIKLSEICNNPLDVDMQISVANDRLLEAGFQKTRYQKSHLSQSIKNLTAEYQNISRDIEDSYEALKATMGELRVYNQNYIRMNDPSMRCKHEKVIKELQARQELFKDLLFLSKLLNDNTEAVDTITRNIAEIRHAINKNYKNLNCKLTEPI